MLVLNRELCHGNAQVQILHAELDEEEVPEGFTVGFGDDAAESKHEEQPGGGKKRAADEVCPLPSCRYLAVRGLCSCAVTAACHACMGANVRRSMAIACVYDYALFVWIVCTQDGEDGGEQSAKRARS